MSSGGQQHNVYKGLYPIREVKQYYRRDFVDGKALYLCLWEGCGYKTWKYSQHIARHIHLAHIGIKELRCDVPGCGKTFKRPESLVSHTQNHSCGFGIDPMKMKDPNNICGNKNVKKYYFREKDNDYYVFGCKWPGCDFVTNNSGSIHRHVHNQHVCPYTAPKNNGNSSNNNHNIGPQSPEFDNNMSNSSGVDQPLIEIIELDPQSVMAKADDSNDNPFEICAKPFDSDPEMEANASLRQSTGGLYSLKHYSDLFTKEKIGSEVHFKCNCNQFTTKSQITLVRHIWNHIGMASFECDVNGCNTKFDNENSLYRHKKNDHNYSSVSPKNEQNSSDASEIGGNSGRNESNLLTFSQTIGALTDDNCSPNNDINAMKSSTSLSHLSQYFTKSLFNNQVLYDCKCGQFQTTSASDLSEHIYLHKGIQTYECKLCSAQFDNESSLSKHKRVDHNLNANQNSLQILPFQQNIDNNYANNSFSLLDESISSTDSLKAENNALKQSKSGFKRSFGSDRNNSGLYSLKNYDKYYKKVKISEGTVSYKCIVCGFSSRSQVSLVRHLWGHTGIDFECDVPGCPERFASETDLYRHRKTHSALSLQPLMNSGNEPTIKSEIIDTKPQTSSIATNGNNTLVHKSGRSASTSSQIRKIMESKTERGIYSLKKYENFFTKVKSDNGFKFVCNCGNFQSKSQATLVRHMWEHQLMNGEFKFEELNGNFDSNETLSQMSNDFEESFERIDNQSVDEEEVVEEEEECEEEVVEEEEAVAEEQPVEAVETVSVSRSRRDLSFKKYRKCEKRNGNEISSEDIVLNKLIAEIEDRGYFCQWPECEFSDDKREEVVSHIKQNHSYDSTDSNENNLMQMSISYDNEMDGNYDTNGSYEESDDNPEQILPQKAAVYSIEDFETLIGTELRDNKTIYVCKATDCRFETALNSSIISHIQQNHIMLSSFYSNSGLVSEEYSETNQTLNQFLCDYNYCNASFPSFENLVEHKKIHSTDNPEYFEDSDEDMEDSNSEGGTKHIKSWKSYSYNGKTSAENADKFSDTVTQNGVQIFRCKCCQYKTTVRGNIIRHIRRHTGDKPFVCQVDGCGKRFAYSTDVKLHQQRDH